MNGKTLHPVQDMRTRLEDIRLVASKPIIDSLALFGGIAGVASALKDVDALDASVAGALAQIISICSILWACSVVSILVYAIWRTGRLISTQPVPFTRNTFLHVVSGEGYIENLERLCGHFRKYKEIVCVCGLSTKGSLGHLTEGGITRSLMQKLIEQTSSLDRQTILAMSNQEIVTQDPVKALQAQIDWEAKRLSKLRASENCLQGQSSEEGMNTSARNTERFRFGDCILVKYDRSAFLDETTLQSTDDSSGFPEKFRILFLVNCSVDGSSPDDSDAIVGPDSASLVKGCFSFLEKKHLDLLFMPALGTNRLDNDHQSVVSSIVQTYCYQAKRSRRSYDLAVTVRKESMDWDGLSLVRLRKYIAEALKFYS